MCRVAEIESIEELIGPLHRAHEDSQNVQRIKLPAIAATTQPTMAAEPTRAVDADDLVCPLMLELDELPEVCEALEPDVELDELIEVDILAEADEEEEATEAEVEAGAEPDEEEALTAPETILP